MYQFLSLQGHGKLMDESIDFVMIVIIVLFISLPGLVTKVFLHSMETELLRIHGHYASGTMDELLHDDGQNQP